MATLITGCGGFIGHFLAEYLTKSGIQDVHSVGRVPVTYKSITHHHCDMANQNELDQVIQKIRPLHVYHLAGLARVSASIGIPEYFKANTLTTHCLLKALSKLKNKVQIFYSSSVHVYGNQTSVVTESSTLHPETEYGFSKYLSEATVRNFVENHSHLSAVIARLYTCIGPGQPEGFAASDFCKKVVALKNTQDKTLKVGPIKAKRQFIDVRDAVQLFPILMKQDFKSRLEVFNLTSPETHTVEQILNMIVKLSKMEIKIDSQNDNNNQLLGLTVSTEKLSKLIPHTRFRPMEETLRDMLAAIA